MNGFAVEPLIKTTINTITAISTITPTINTITDVSSISVIISWPRADITILADGTMIERKQICMITYIMNEFTMITADTSNRTIGCLPLAPRPWRSRKRGGVYSFGYVVTVRRVPHRLSLSTALGSIITNAITTGLANITASAIIGRPIMSMMSMMTMSTMTNAPSERRKRASLRQGTGRVWSR